jgi:succinyl-diaminopimelate desuccinylase
VSRPDSGAQGALDLLALAAEIVDIPSVSHDEAALADVVEADLSRVPWLQMERIGDTVVARTDQGRGARVVVAGHLDTVPGRGPVRANIDGDVLSGLGAVDMKGGVAVMLALAVTIQQPVVDVTYVFYSCEEVRRADNGLAQLAATRPELIAADAAVLCEPTSGLVEAGCQGTLHAIARLRGKRAHTARPFKGVNAIHRTAALLERLGAYEPRRVVLEGCEYVEQLQAVSIEGGIAANVVPDEASVKINFRFAPDRDSNSAVSQLHELLDVAIDEGAGDSLELIEVTPGAPPSLSEPPIARLVEAAGRPARAKVGWTDVATFAAIGIPAANFGPGDPLLAHTADERVSREELERVYDVLATLLTRTG